MEGERFRRRTAVFQLRMVRNLALREYIVAVRGPPPADYKPYCSPLDVYYVVLCVPLYGRRTGAVRWKVLEHAVSSINELHFPGIMGLPPSGTSRPWMHPPFNSSLSRSFVVGSTCWVGIWVCEVIKCSYFVCRRFDIWQLFPVATRLFWVAFGRIVDSSLGMKHITSLRDKEERPRSSIWYFLNMKLEIYAKTYFFVVIGGDCFQIFCDDGLTKHSCSQVWFHNELQRIWLYTIDQKTLECVQ